jgi:hypothetical protein
VAPRRLQIPVVAAIAILPAIDAACAASAPQQLVGKSIVVKWREDQTQVTESGSPRQVVIHQNLSTYVSTKGEIFTRRTAMNQRGQTGAEERVGASGRSARGASSSLFSGRSLVVTGASSGGVARRIQVDFDATYSACTASVVVGTPPGQKARFHGTIERDKIFEIKSISAVGPTCEIAAGNVFGNQ